MTYGDKVREQRKLAGLSQRQLAARLAEIFGRNYEQCSVSNVERGVLANPQLATMQAYAQAIGCTVVDLLP